MLIASHFEGESAWITVDLMQESWPAQLGRNVYMKALVLQGPQRAFIRMRRNKPRTLGLTQTLAAFQK